MAPSDEAPSDSAFWRVSGDAALAEAVLAEDDEQRAARYREALSCFERVIEGTHEIVFGFLGKALALLGLAEEGSAEKSSRIAWLEEADRCFARCRPWPISLSQFPAWLRALRLLVELSEEAGVTQACHSRAAQICATARGLAASDRRHFDFNHRHLLGSEELPESVRKKAALQHATHCCELLSDWPDPPASFGIQWALTLKHQALEQGGEDSVIFLQAAAEKSRAAILLGAQYDEYLDHAKILEELALRSSLELRRQLLREAADSLKEASRKHPKGPWILEARGRLLLKLANHSALADRVDVLEAARTCHAEAHALRESAINLCCWADTLEALSFRQSGNGAKVALLREAEGHMKRASLLEPRSSLYCRRHGILLLSLANCFYEDPQQQRALWLEALDGLNTAVRLAPDQASGWHYRGKALLNLCQEEQDPTLAPGYAKDAAECFRRASKLSPGEHLYHGYLGQAFRDSAKYEEFPKKKARALARAAGSLARASELKPDYMWHFHEWAMVLQNQAKQEHSSDEKRALLVGCIRKYKAALNLKPVLGSTLINLAVAYADLAELSKSDRRRELIEQAIDHARKACEMDSKSEDFLGRMAHLLRRRGNMLDEGALRISSFKEAVEVFDCLEDCGHRPAEVRYGRGLVFWDWAMATKGNSEASALLDKAVANFLKAHELAPEDSVPLYQAARCHRELEFYQRDRMAKVDHFGKSIALIEKATALAPSRSHYYRFWGSMLMGLASTLGASEGWTSGNRIQQLLDQAAARFETATDLNAADGGAWLGWGSVLLDLGRDHFDREERSKFCDLAREKFSRAISCGKRMAYFDLARVEARCRKVEAAVAALDRWRKLDAKARLEKLHRYSDFHDIENHPAFREFLSTWQA